VNNCPLKKRLDIIPVIVLTATAQALKVIGDYEYHHIPKTSITVMNTKYQALKFSLACQTRKIQETTPLTLALWILDPWDHPKRKTSCNLLTLA
jgi:hypothetical protein